MKKVFKRVFVFLFAILVVAGLVYHLGLRRWCLRWGTTETEYRSAMPGDELPSAFSPGSATHAITIQAPPEKVWPWIMQMGQDRSGFYSYTFLENLFGADMPKVERLMPDWKPRAQGETVWFCTPKRYGGQGRMVAAIVQPERAFVMVMPGDWRRLQDGQSMQEASWGFTLERVEGTQTRLIARMRMGEPPTWQTRMINRLFWEPAHFVMEQKMLRRIRDLSEQS